MFISLISSSTRIKHSVAHPCSKPQRPAKFAILSGAIRVEKALYERYVATLRSDTERRAMWRLAFEVAEWETERSGNGRLREVVVTHCLLKK